MEKGFYYTIGLEIHAELKTNTKMFCSCKNDPDEEKPNKNICPVCMAHPGALPVVNKRAVESVIKVGLAIGGNIADFTEFDRKNYFYPDIPKGYQISQYKYPIVSGGRLANFDVTRVHLEEDTANNKHDRGDFSLVDFNRAGVPLMELVTEPHTFSDGEEASKGASNFAKELQLVLWYLGVSEANMEKGEMRVEANISVSKDKSKFGTKVEVKNLNSFRSVERAIKFEFERMSNLIEEGKIDEIVQETRGWDESKQKTFSQRKKESSHDYRYFPDPDLPKMKLHEAFDLKKMKEELPELPVAKRERYKKDYGLKDEDVEVYLNNPELDSFFVNVLKTILSSGVSEESTLLGNPVDFKVTSKVSNYIISDLLGIIKSNSNYELPSYLYFAKLIDMLLKEKITSRSAKDVLLVVVTDNKDPEIIVKENNLIQTVDEGVINNIAQRVIVENPQAVKDYKDGKENAIMSLVGKVIKESKGSANPQMVIEMLKNLLK